MLGMLLATPARLAFGAGVVAVSVAGVAGLTSSALFTETQGSGANTITTGTVSIDPDSTTTAVISASNAKPGDSWTRDLVVKNDGSISLTYTIASSMTDTTSPSPKLGATLTATLVTGTCASQATTAGTSLYSGAFNVIAVSSARALASTATEALCLTVELPSATGNTYQGQGPVVNNLQFTATQAS